MIMKEKILKWCLPGFYMLAIFGALITGIDYYHEIQKQKNRLLKINNVLEVDKIGEYVELELNNQNKDQEVVFEVDNTDIVDVTEDGTLLSVGEGITTITVTNEENTKTQTFVVGVGEGAIKDLKENKQKVEQLIEENKILLPPTNSTPNKENNSTNKPTENESNNSSTETTPPEEIIPKPTIIKVTNVSLDKSYLTLNFNETTKLTATISPSNATNKNVSWKSSNSKLVTVDNNGNIKVVGNKNGKVTITATSNDGNFKASATINVKEVDETVNVNGVKINEGSSKIIYLNNFNTEKKFQLTATISPSNATNKNVTWLSSNTTVATVDNNGNITVNGLGNANITVSTNDGNYKATYKLTIKQKAIVVITASAGVRMNNWFTSYTSSKNNHYSKSLGTLNYVFKSGAGFEYQYNEGLTKAQNTIDTKYSKVKNYVELSIFFTLTGNSVKSYTCDDIETNKDGLYTNTAEKYNTAIQSIINKGYSNTKGFIISHSPLNTKQAINELNKSGFAYSHKPEACKSGYRSAWKYWISNRQMESILKNGNYSNLKFVDNYSNFVVINNETERTFTWLRDYYRTTDGLHWDEKTTKDYMQLAFDTAGM